VKNITKKSKSIWSQSKFLIVIFLTLAALMITSALNELSQSKKELYTLMEAQAKSLIESILISSENSLLSNQAITKHIEIRLLNNAAFVKHLYSENSVSNQKLTELCDQNNLYRINIFSNTGEKLFFSHEQIHFPNEKPFSAKDIYQPILDGTVDTLIVGVVPARYEDGNRFAVAISGPNNSAIVVNIDAEEILDIRRSIGFGPMLRNIVEQNSSIVFAALQDTSDILAASGNVLELESILSSDFLNNALKKATFASRIADFDLIEVFEVVHPFNYNDRQIGLLRIGLSMHPIEDINKRVYRRLSIISIILFVIGSIIFALVFIRQRLSLLSKQYSTVETYSSNIINNASDAIIVFNESNGIRIFNKTAEILFGIKETEAINKKIGVLFSKSEIEDLVTTNEPVVNFSYESNDSLKYLLVSKTNFEDDGILNTILLIRDLTEQKLMEEQLERNQRLSAMGELASGVAHEIRNPLNSISTIVQQLDKDFAPEDNKEEYHELSQIVYKEIKRINQTVQNFLQFAKPELIKTEQFEISNLFDELKVQYGSILKEKKIELKIDQKWKGDVKWDYNKIKQTLINLMDNAIDAINDEGKINIVIQNINEWISIEFKDSGKGFSKTEQQKIFNLYYTTKASGTGIGLSIVQRIIFEHGGTISVKSAKNKGTTFIINLPINSK